ncbi:hypothetical protein M5D96_012194 [Drosophila gunungcola]|uniref:Uncharacterized protein n=1 Tax=Drosophila gunungcola TaxID=103775 RepID=A0A9Q0BK86_9MUSC|nr:hypothetical protein M5D96_012194 [Drosophila gunungcola]
MCQLAKWRPHSRDLFIFPFPLNGLCLKQAILGCNQCITLAFCCLANIYLSKL